MLKRSVVAISIIDVVFTIYYLLIGSVMDVMYHDNKYFIIFRMILALFSGLSVWRMRNPYGIIVASLTLTAIISYEFICMQTAEDMYICEDCVLHYKNILIGNIQNVFIFFLIPNFFIFQLIGRQIDIIRFGFNSRVCPDR